MRSLDMLLILICTQLLGEQISGMSRIKQDHITPRSYFRKGSEMQKL